MIVPTCPRSYILPQLGSRAPASPDNSSPSSRYPSSPVLPRFRPYPMRIVLPASKAAGSAMTQRVTVSGTAAPTIPSSTPASRGDLTGCPWNDAKTKLRGRAPPHAATPGAGPDPVRQRRPPRDRRNAIRGSQPGQCAVATVYHTLNFFTGVGLLRQVAVDGSKSYFEPTIPSIVTSTSRISTSLWTFSFPMLSSMKPLCRRMETKSFAST
jgi:hypothetical protein